MNEDLVLLLMGVMVAAMILAVMIVQSRLSKGRPEESEEPADDKVYVELGFEPEEEPEEAPPEPVDDSVEFDLAPIEPAYEAVDDLPQLEPEEVFFGESFEASEPVVIETPMIIMENPEPVEEPVKPLFEASYEPAEPVVIEAPEMVVIEEPKTVEFETGEGPMFEIAYQESEPVVIETERMILEPEEDVEPAPVEEPELLDETPEPEEAPVVEEIEVIEEEPLPEIEPVELEPIVVETPEIAEEPEVVEGVEAPKPRTRRRLRKPIIDESDPAINLDMGIKSCPHCGSEVPDTIYCINCGKSLDP
ncbi:hypothetical protein KAI10_00245 [Candidatus Bathyarchaeota archaeon]|nr:hypothetical protein [Candidatus Bathyarchaeota archaeon]